jgi:predicted amidohydrolase
MVKVAAAQIRVLDNIDANLQRILHYIRQAKSRGAEIICFPETSLNSDENNMPDVSLHIKKIQEKCKEESIWCIVGSYVPRGGG